MKELSLGETQRSTMEDEGTKRYHAPPQPPSPHATDQRTDKLRSSDFPLWRPVVDNNLRHSFFLPSTATLSVVRNIPSSKLSDREEPSSRDQKVNSSSQGNIGDHQRKTDEQRAMSPMSLLMIRSDY
jgi:hypothetical protein